MKNTKRTEEKVNAIINEILDDDQGNNFSATQTENCPRDCKGPDNTPKEVSIRNLHSYNNNYLSLKFLFI